MERVAPSLFNLDFESCLKNSKYSFPSWKPINGELEHLFFWVCNEGDSLLTEKKYESDYLHYLELLTKRPPEVISSFESPQLWWGDLSSEEKWHNERLLNSKVECTLNRKELSLNSFDSFICQNKEELKAAVDHVGKKFVIKEEFNFSGKGLSFNEDSTKQSFPCVVEPWVKRVRDFSIFISDDEFFLSQSQSDSRGAYKGSHIKKSFSEEPLLKEKSVQIWDFYKKKYDCDFLQIDAFQYLDGKGLVLNALGEINHRQSLGQIFNKIHLKFGSHYSFMGLIPTKSLVGNNSFGDLLSSFEKYQYNPITKQGVIALSPGRERFSCFFFTEESERTLQFLIRDWWKKVVKKEEKLPPEFIIYL